MSVLDWLIVIFLVGIVLYALLHRSVFKSNDDDDYPPN